MQVSPSGMAAASQAVPGEFDSRHLLQKEKHTQSGVFLFLERLTPSKRFDFLTRNCFSRSGTANAWLMRLLISPLKSIINAFLNG